MSFYSNFFFPLVFLLLLIVGIMLFFKLLNLSIKSLFLILKFGLIFLIVNLFFLFVQPLSLLPSNLVVYFQVNYLSLGILFVNLLFLVFLIFYFPLTEFFFYVVWLLLLLIFGFHLLLIANNLIFLVFSLEFVALTIVVLLSLYSTNGVFANNILNYFLLNSLLSGFLYFSVFFLLYTNHYNYDYIFWSFFTSEGTLINWILLFIFLFKLGVAPIHVIQISVYERLPWYIFFFLLKMYKLVLFFVFCKLILFLNFSNNLFFIGLLSMFVGALQPYWSYSLRNLLFSSSLFIYGTALLLVSINYVSWALGFVFTYTLFSGFFFFILIGIETNNLIVLDFLNNLTKQHVQLYNLIFFLTGWFLSGIPPTIFFFFKSSILNIFVINFGYMWIFWLFLIFVLSTVGYFRLFKIIFFDATFTTTNAKGFSFFILSCIIFFLTFILSDIWYFVIFHFLNLVNGFIL